ncbi:flagellin [Candidimonas sp. SYP-B2681]|uniref:flagellin N-terminal helical domain-containing protein n=1 Tax=Candidimonas sp. SYP-B2681 TaxID=2497686 RepID=UPI0013156431|nr:flagellin [Candidimonas sp. SYP-B2681]
MKIQTNLTALLSQQALRGSGKSLSEAIERLSSGLRINSAKDDAAGLAIANRITSQVRGRDQAQRNAMDAIGMAQTAEAGVNEMNAALQRVRELVVQAGNGTLSASDRHTIQHEVDQRLAQIQDISQNTSFNGIELLRNTGSLCMQVGPNNTEADVFPFNLRALDLTALGLENGLFPFRIVEGGNPLPLSPPIQTTHAGTGVNAGSYKLQVNGVTHWDTVLNLEQAAAYYGTTPAEVTIHRVIDPLSGAEVQGYFIAKLGDHYMIEEDKSLQLDFAKGTATLVITSHKGRTFIDPDNGVSVPQRATEATIIAKSGMTPDGKVVLYYDFQGKAFARNGGPFVLSGPRANDIAIVRQTPSTAEPLMKIDAAIAELSAYRSYLGSAQNRLESIVIGHQNANISLTQARSRIEDADYAQEVSRMTRSKILQQAGAAVLAQANQHPRQVLSLLT